MWVVDVAVVDVGPRVVIFGGRVVFFDFLGGCVVFFDFLVTTVVSA
jgi:hypothetical protein